MHGQFFNLARASCLVSQNLDILIIGLFALLENQTEISPRASHLPGMLSVG